MASDNIDLDNFNKIKNATEVHYKKIGSIFCPALKSDIAFNSDGFHHLRYDGSRSERSKKVQQNKFTCLNSAIEILKKSTTIQEYRRSICPVGKPNSKGFRKTKTVEWFGFFAIISFAKCIRINIVVRRIGEESGKYHFWSVMPYWTLSNNNRRIGSEKIKDE